MGLADNFGGHTHRAGASCSYSDLPHALNTLESNTLHHYQPLKNPLQLCAARSQGLLHLPDKSCMQCASLANSAGIGGGAYVKTLLLHACQWGARVSMLYCALIRA